MTTNEPLASRLRPKTLDEIIGQSHILGQDKMLTRMIKADNIGNIILYGPPGTGKTTLASVIANTTNADFQAINATTSSKTEMQKIIAKANNKRTILFIDEIHRFNKAQQDYLLPFTENGTISLIGATTENPYFEINGALLSRSTIFELKPIEKDDMKSLILKAVYEGMGAYNPVIYPDAVEFLADIAEGDARRCLNAIELAVTTTEPVNNQVVLTLDVIKESVQKRNVRYDKDGDMHYDTISAFIKSIRGSDPDAAVYYLARMLAAGEDPKFITRRLMIHASEDIGMADPMALVIATNAALATERVGLPEAEIILANAVIYMAMAPKSASSIDAIKTAQNTVKCTGNLPIPSYLQDAHYKSASKLDRGVGYKYPHDFDNHWVEQQYLPDNIKNTKIYNPSNIGFEKQINDYHKLLSSLSKGV